MADGTHAAVPVHDLAGDRDAGVAAEEARRFRQVIGRANALRGMAFGGLPTRPCPSTGGLKTIGWRSHISMHRRRMATKAEG